VDPNSASLPPSAEDTPRQFPHFSCKPFRFCTPAISQLAALLALSSLGCSPVRRVPVAPHTAPALVGDRNHPGKTSAWVETELYFGLGPVDHPDQGISESRWRRFLDEEVTPNFPGGLSVVDVYGQWKGKNEPSPERLRSKLLIIDCPNNLENRNKIDAIRSAWKRMTGDQSVLRVTVPADVSF
jgi:Protein of unknown function (DUF3574)